MIKKEIETRVEEKEEIMNKSCMFNGVKIPE